MPKVDLRKPALVTEDFRRRIADLLVPRGFDVRAKGALVRRAGKSAHRVEFSSSHLNHPGHAICWISFAYEDAAVRARHPGWRTGGFLHGHVFDGSTSSQSLNVADADAAAALAALVLERLAFFDLMEAPERVLAEVSRRYVPGMVEPQVIVPYLAVRLGPDAAVSYARALLRGRQELWPAFSSARADAAARPPNPQADHGTQLATALAGVAAVLPDAAPADAVASTEPPARSLRSFFGLQLRAWGEPAATAALRRVADAAVREVHATQKALGVAIVDSEAAARIVLRAAGEDRAPRRQAPEPRLFQYHPLHAPFA